MDLNDLTEVVKKILYRWRIKFVVQCSFIVLILCLAAIVLPWRASGAVSVVVEDVRVGLALQVLTQDFSVTGEYQIVESTSGAPLARISPGEKWQARFIDGKIELLKNGAPLGIYNHPVTVKEVMQNIAIQSGHGSITNITTTDGIMALGAGGKMSSLPPEPGKCQVLSAGGQYPLNAVAGQNLVALNSGGAVKRYRGGIEFRPLADGMAVINQLPLEQYLYGVVPVEMPSTWPAEALKAQAVAARSYALSQIAAGAYSAYGFDLMATQQSQVYLGYDGENQLVNKLVESTRGQVMTYRDRVINAFFHSSSGGYTENSEDVWKDPLDYIRSKPDPMDRNDKHYNWVVSYDHAQLVSQLIQKGYNFSKVLDIEELSRTKSGARVQRVAVLGFDPDGKSLRTEIYNADSVRIALGLKSSLFTMSKEMDPRGGIARVTFTGSGWGHGLGMSQYGALGMAKQGYNYQEILKYYYNSVEIKPL